MPKKEHPNIITLLRHLCAALQSFAHTSNIKLHFTSSIKEACFDYKTDEVICSISKLLCAIINHMPAGNTLTVNTAVIEKDNLQQLCIEIINTGINLERVPAITKHCNMPVQVSAGAANQTSFTILYPIAVLPALTAVAQQPPAATYQDIPLFYAQVKKQLRQHFAKVNDPLIRLKETNPAEAGFLAKLNQCILQKLDDERFDANGLSMSMAISRAQLLRKLKSMLGVSPGYYIKSLRLEKAKKMLETSELSVSEVAYKTGFQSPSHFTKIFGDKYGIRPSMLRRPKLHATNE